MSKYQNVFLKVSHLLECVLLGCFLFFLRWFCEALP